MLRDFSNKSKQEILALVSEVENSKICDFTDWVGDRWLDFSEWIGQLNIRNYINNINSYHRKVIDKNNATKEAINRIFENVNSIDKTYQTKFHDTNELLKQWSKYIDSLNDIINPHNGQFNTDYITYRMKKIMDEIIKSEVNNIRKYLNNDSSIDNDYGRQLLMDLLNKSISDMTDEERELLSDILKNPNMYNEAFVSIDKSKSTSLNDTNGLSGLDMMALMNMILMNYSGEDNLNIDQFGDVTKFLSNVTKNIGKYGKDEDAKLASSVLSYISKLCGISDLSEKSGIDATSYILSLGKTSIGVEEAYYKYFLKTLHPKEAAKLDAKFGKGMMGLSLFADILSMSTEGIDTYKIFSNSENSVYDKTAQGLKMGQSVFDFLGDAYITVVGSDKAIRVIGKTAGNSKVVNQILATDVGIQYGTSTTITKKISNAGTVIAIGDVVLSTGSAGVKRFGEVYADGKIDGVDVGSIGVYGSLSGLDSVTSNLTLGLVHFDSEEVAADLEKRSTDFLNEDNWASNYIKDQSKNAVGRFAVSVGVGAYIVGEKAVTGVADAAKTVGSWVSTGWNYVTNFIN